MKGIIKIFFLISLVVCGVSAKAFSHPLQNKKAPYIALHDGEEIFHHLDEMTKEANLIVLTFFSKDCVECKKETEVFNRINKKYKDQKVMIIWILVGEDEKATKKLKEEWGIDFLVLSDKFGESAKDYLIGNQFPQTFFINKNGIIRWYKPGGFTDRELYDKIKELLYEYKK